MFSRRLPWERPENALARLLAARRAAGAALLDLATSNPTRVGLAYPADEIVAALARPETAWYDPAPLGLAAAREAVAGDYARRGARVAPERIVITASSSEAYALLFKLCCDPGDAVLVPEPSYPLFAYLACLEGVEPRPYRLAFDGVWHTDFASLDRAAAPGRARAVVAVSPNNPTGSCLKSDELHRLTEFCAARDLVLIADEVFADYVMGAAADRVADVLATRSPAVTFSLGGLSKSCGLPQLKLGWLAVTGPEASVGAALARLELVADTYLSVATPVQVALPRLLEIGGGIRAQIRARITANRAELARMLGPAAPWSLLPSEGGWSAILRVPATSSDEDQAAALLAEDDVLVYPGAFFDMPPGAYLIASLLPEPSQFSEAMGRILAHLERAATAGRHADRGP